MAGRKFIHLGVVVSKSSGNREGAITMHPRLQISIAGSHPRPRILQVHVRYIRLCDLTQVLSLLVS